MGRLCLFAAVTLFVIYVPGVNTAFEFAAIDVKEYFIAVGLAFTVLPFVELTKLIRRAAGRKKSK